jgi:RNA polymerase sigma-B factor
MGMKQAPDKRFANLSNEEMIELLRRTSEADAMPGELSALREEIVNHNIGLVKSIALKFLHSGELLDDLVQAGYIGLLNAVANFDLAKGIRFSTYASYLIKGEIRHYIRDKHTTIRIPQWIQEMSHRVKQAEDAFFQELGRPPTLSELAARVDLTEAQVIELLRGRNAMTYVSIDADRRRSDPAPSAPMLESLAPETPSGGVEVNLRIAAVIEQLETIQRRVLQGLFYQDKTQTQVGEELGMSQRQVSRMKDQALRAVRGRLFPKGRDDSRDDSNKASS